MHGYEQRSNVHGVEERGAAAGAVTHGLQVALHLALDRSEQLLGPVVPLGERAPSGVMIKSGFWQVDG